MTLKLMKCAYFSCCYVGQALSLSEALFGKDKSMHKKGNLLLISSVGLFYHVLRNVLFILHLKMKSGLKLSQLGKKEEKNTSQNGAKIMEIGYEIRKLQHFKFFLYFWETFPHEY